MSAPTPGEVYARAGERLVAQTRDEVVRRMEAAAHEAQRLGVGILVMTDGPGGGLLSARADGRVPPGEVLEAPSVAALHAYLRHRDRESARG